MNSDNRKRDRLEVIYDILKIIQKNNNSIRITPLLRETNISSKNFYSYYEELLKKNFIREEVNKKKQKYITLTDTGFKYIQKYKLILGFIEEFEL